MRPVHRRSSLASIVQPPGGGFNQGNTMKTLLSRAGLLAAACLAFSGVASAQSPNGFASIIHVPVVVSTGTFQTTLFIHNPGGSVSVNAKYYGATGTADAGTVLNCGNINVAGGRTESFNIASLCNFSGASNFGTLRLVESDNQDPHPIAAYTRVQSFTGNGFSIEGFPLAEFSNAVGKSVVLGLRRDAAAPGYGSNCFASSIGDPVVVSMSLFDGANTQLGTPYTFTLAANETQRVLDVFTAVGALDGDFANVRAEFSLALGNVGNPSFSAFCTVQNNTSFDADFRIAKTVAPDDQSHLYFVTQTDNGLGGPFVIPAGKKAVYAVFLKHPDYFECQITGDGADKSEIQIKNPAGVVVAGGDNVKTINKFYLGDKLSAGNGANSVWFVEMGTKDGLGDDKSRLNCKSGAGMTRPFVIGYLDDDF
jgi:hypothetical protein